MADRQDEGAANSTIQKETTALKRAFNLAAEDGLISHGSKPKIPTPDVQNVRKGFFTEGELQAVIDELPDDLKPVDQFAALTAWRKAEILSLRWSVRVFQEQTP